MNFFCINAFFYFKSSLYLTASSVIYTIPIPYLNLLAHYLKIHMSYKKYWSIIIFYSLLSVQGRMTSYPHILWEILEMLNIFTFNIFRIISHFEMIKSKINWLKWAQHELNFQPAFWNILCERNLLPIKALHFPIFITSRHIVTKSRLHVLSSSLFCRKFLLGYIIV